MNLVRADYLPSIALIGGFMGTNPSVFNSFEKKFKGMWNLGVTVSLPIWHWGEPQAGMTIEECERFVRTVPCYERRFAYGRELRISIL